jgi:hypothetical protein
VEPPWREELRALLAADAERIEREAKEATDMRAAAGQAKAGCQETLIGDFYPPLELYVRAINVGDYAGSLSPRVAGMADVTLSFWRRHEPQKRSTIRFLCQGGEVVAVEEHLPSPGTASPTRNQRPATPVILAQLPDRLNQWVRTALERLPRW